ncbi:anthrone oxygenase family protein [Hoeflea sp. CAU 1731]
MNLIKTLSISSILFCGAIFGFFYAWVCSTMWGLDQADPRIAIAAMQAMNASVRNGAFFPAFFLTPLVLAATAGVAYRSQFRSAAFWFAAAGLVYLIFGLLLTMGVNVPMNEALASVDIPEDVGAAEIIWQDYSPSWQFWNQLRTIASGIALTFAGIGLSKV